MVTTVRRRRLPPYMRPRAHVPRPTAAPVREWQVGHYDGPTDLDEQIRWAKFVATGLVQPIYARNPGACLSLLMKAQALDIPRATALEHLYWNPAIGKGSISSQLMAYLLHRAGYEFKVIEHTDQRVSMTFYRTVAGRRRRLGDVDWTILEAIAAGLTWREQWRLYPSDMLWARCLMRGARRHAPGIGAGGAYTVEEIQDMSAPAEGGEVHAAVQDILTKATADDVTSDQIRNDLVKVAKARKLLDFDTGDGQTLGYVLGMLWGQARAREADAHQLASPAVEETPSAPAGTGTLPCGCPAEHVLRTGVHNLAVHRD